MLRGVASSPSEQERSELEALLQARVLVRSPTVLRIAEYIVRKYLEGDASSLKEYNIAIEALGKPADFDSRRDSIVRVEAHRLRKKIAEYYRTEGASRTLRVVLDPGQYVPRFELATFDPGTREAAASLPVAHNLPGAVLLDPAEMAPSVQRRSLAGSRIAGAAATLAFVAAVLVWFFHSSNHPPRDSIWLLAGSPRGAVVISESGAVWHGDKWFSGGSSVSGAPPISALPDVVHPFQRQGNFNYDIPLAAAPYELRLYWGLRAASRGTEGHTGYGFDVYSNGVKLLNALDPEIGVERKGHDVVRVFHDIRPAPDGKLHLAFRSGKEIAYVNAIELTPGIPGRLAPIRMIARSSPYVEPGGKRWRSDKPLATGGTLKIRTNLVSGGVDQNIVSGERWGAFKYEIPVSKGTYALKLYFAESWFGPGLDGGGGPGSRRFDVYANWMPLLQDFDIIREAPGSSRAIVKQFHGLAPGADGYIILSFVPRVNFACIDALELIDESR